VEHRIATLARARSKGHKYPFTFPLSRIGLPPRNLCQDLSKRKGHPIAPNEIDRIQNACRKVAVLRSELLNPPVNSSFRDVDSVSREVI
jgi:hypothetical protein